MVFILYRAGTFARYNKCERERTMTANDTQTRPPLKPAPADNGMTDERWEEILAFIAKHKNNTGYFERGREQVAEVRRQIQEQAERDFNEPEDK